MPVYESVLLIAVFGQVGLTFFVLVRMARARVAVLKARKVSLGEVALSTDAYPEHIQKLQNNFRNQFETPVLLYGGAGVALAVGAVNGGVALGALIFLVSRILHHVVHCGSNDMRRRFSVFSVGVVGLAVMWIALALGVFGG